VCLIKTNVLTSQDDTEKQFSGVPIPMGMSTKQGSVHVRIAACFFFPIFAGLLILDFTL